MCQTPDIKRPMFRTDENIITCLLRVPVIFTIKAYRLFSPIKQVFLGPYARCRFYPTCSEYSLECFKHLPLLKAFSKSLARVGRCNPFHPGGYDPVFEECEITQKPEKTS